MPTTDTVSQALITTEISPGHLFIVSQALIMIEISPEHLFTISQALSTLEIIHTDEFVQII